MIATAPDVVAARMDADGQVESEDLAALRHPLRQLRHLFVSNPLRVDVIALIDWVDVAPPEQTAPKWSGPAVPVDPEAIDGGAKARILDKIRALEHEVA